MRPTPNPTPNPTPTPPSAPGCPAASGPVMNGSGACVISKSRPRWSFRAPTPPFPVEPFELAHPEVPAELEGLRILHLSDSHIGRARPRPGHHASTVEAVRRTDADLVILTGDYMTHPGDEDAAIRALSDLASAWSTRFGAFAIGGNHDTPKFLRAAARIPQVRWLNHESVEIPIDLGKGSTALRIVGSGFPESLLVAANTTTSSAPFSLTLVHYPTEIYAAAQLGLPIVLCGHTHGGQIRPHKTHAPHTSCDLPSGLVSGVFRLQNSLLCISRGLGSAVLPLRFNCPEQAPLYTLRRKAWPAPSCESLRPLARW